MKPPTPPITPPATLPISGPYFRTVLTKNPATLGMILEANEMIELRNSCLSLPSNSFRLISFSRSNYIFLVLGSILSFAIVRLENFTPTFFSPVDSSRALVKTSPSSLQNTLSSICLELLAFFLGYFFASSAAFSAANSMNCPSLTKKEVLPKGDIRIVIPVSVSILCRQKGVEEPCCKFLPSLFSIGQVMNIQQLTSSALIKDRSISCSLAMPKIDPPGIVTSVEWMTLTLGEQYSVSRQMIGPIIASTKQVMPKETLKRRGSLNVSNQGQGYSGDCFAQDCFAYIIILNQFDQLPRFFQTNEIISLAKS